MTKRRRSPLRIGLNLLFLIPGGVGGTEVYCRNLLQSLARVDATNQYFIFRNVETEAGIVPAASNFIDCPQAVRATSRPARIVYEQSVLILEILRRRVDVLFNGGSTAPLLCPVPMVTVHYDLQHRVYPEFLSRLELLAYRLLLPAATRRSKRVVTMSEAARQQLERFYPWCARKVDIVPHGIETRFAEIAAARALAHEPDEPFILAVSTLGPNKNFDRLLHAYARFHASHPNLKLVVAGIKGSQTGKLETLRESLGLTRSVTFTGWIPREELYGLFERATAFVYPSIFEGFGIPVLEAMAAGIPTACSALPSLLEIARDGARFFDPCDTGDISAALGDVTDDAALRDRLTQTGRLRALDFGWEASALRLVETLTQAAAGARRLPVAPRYEPSISAAPRP